VPLPKVRGVSEAEVFKVVKTGKSRRMFITSVCLFVSVFVETNHSAVSLIFHCMHVISLYAAYITVALIILVLLACKLCLRCQTVSAKAIMFLGCTVVRFILPIIYYIVTTVSHEWLQRF